VQYDACIIDCTDVIFEEGVARSLYEENFYASLKSVLKPEAGFSQMITCEEA